VHAIEIRWDWLLRWLANAKIHAERKVDVINKNTGQSPEYVIVVTQLRKRYGDRVAVDGIDLAIARGETFGLLGPNGAGKTTTIKMLIGLLRPDEGMVHISKGDPWLPETRRRLGVAPQSLALYENLSAHENLAFFGRLHGLRSRDLSQRIEWSLELSGLLDRRHDRVHTYSGGMKRRLNIAVSLVHRPEVLLLDEPTAGVDPQSRNHIFECIQRLNHEGLTIVYTTHYMEEAERLCDRVAVMDHGRLLAVDSVPGLLKTYGGRSVIQMDVLHIPQQAEITGVRAGDSVRVESDRPFEELAKLHAQGVHLRGVKVNDPDLESVFLTLTGRSLRD
jgi:ABC-2 type transport system ATP-binding protein